MDNARLGARYSDGTVWDQPVLQRPGASVSILAFQMVQCTCGMSLGIHFQDALVTLHDMLPRPAAPHKPVVVGRVSKRQRQQLEQQFSRAWWAYLSKSCAAGTYAYRRTTAAKHALFVQDLLYDKFVLLQCDGQGRRGGARQLGVGQAPRCVRPSSHTQQEDHPPLPPTRGAIA